MNYKAQSLRKIGFAIHSLKIKKVLPQKGARHIRHAVPPKFSKFIEICPFAANNGADRCAFDKIICVRRTLRGGILHFVHRACFQPTTHTLCCELSMRLPHLCFEFAIHFKVIVTPDSKIVKVECNFSGFSDIPFYSNQDFFGSKLRKWFPVFVWKAINK
jgi:hypothetical protein